MIFDGIIRNWGILGAHYNKIGELFPYSVFILLTLACMFFAYLVGSLNFAIIISKLKYKDDIRKYGSGNAGMTNMMRTYGKAAGICTFIGDIMKGIVSVMLTELLLGEPAAYLAGLACILGHAYPCWYKFKGGKGVAVSASILLALEPLMFVIHVIIFLAVTLFTKYVSVGSISTALMLPLTLEIIYPLTHNNEYHPLYFIIMLTAVIITALVIFLHRENMKRLLDHSENKINLKKKDKKKKSDNNENL